MKKWLVIMALAAVAGWFLPQSAQAQERKSNPEIDLPIEKPTPKQIQEEEEEDEGDVTFYGEELDAETDSIVYVVDYSCSMYGSRIAKAKMEVNKSIAALSENFKFSVVAYDCYVSVWSSKLKKATAENKQSAQAWINGQNPRGATGTGLAVKKGLEIDRDCKLVVLLTDGAPNCLGSSWGSASDHLSLITRSNQQKAKINVFAIQPWSSSYRSFCQKVASTSGGTYKEVN
ncbi:MAG: VWA domain-containing protein [Planctomycetota bacterium]|nr:MAG: VWA domain-containing protein [Planctomycetota bacterium]